MTTAVEFKNVDIVFGEREAEGLKLLDQGASRSEILEKTGAVLGCAGANLAVKEGEISVLMGLSGSGKSTLLRAVNGLTIQGGTSTSKDKSPAWRCTRSTIVAPGTASAAATTSGRPCSRPSGK